MVLAPAVSMSLMDVSKMFSLLQPREEEEDSEPCRALQGAVSADDHALLSDLLTQDSFRRAINARSGWGVPVTPLRSAAALGHLRCLKVLLEHGAEVRLGGELRDSSHFVSTDDNFQAGGAIKSLLCTSTHTQYLPADKPEQCWACAALLGNICKQQGRIF